MGHGNDRVSFAWRAMDAVDAPEPGQAVTPHGVDRGLDIDEIAGSAR